MRPGEANRAQLAKLTEAQWQETVIEAAQMLGWRVAHFRMARTKKGWRTPVAADGMGFPDLVLLRSRADSDRRLIFSELKREGGNLRPAQREWMFGLELLADVSDHVEAYVWRPTDLDQVLEILK